MLPGYCYCILDILYSNHVVVIGFYRNNFLYKSWQSSQFAKNCPVMCFSTSSSVRISVSVLEMQFNAMEHVTCSCTTNDIREAKLTWRHRYLNNNPSEAVQRIVTVTQAHCHQPCPCPQQNQSAQPITSPGLASSLACMYNPVPTDSSLYPSFTISSLHPPPHIPS